MGQVLVRGLDDGALERLKKRAEGNQRSLEAELRDILIAASRQVSMEEARRRCRELRESLAGKIQGDSAELIREDRDTR